MAKKVVYEELKNIRKWDEETSKKGMDTILLMENAGAEIARFVEKKFKNKKALIVFGKGNNAADCIVAARHLITKGFDIKLHPIFEESEYNYLLKKQLQIIKTLKPNFVDKINGLDIDIIIDGILGTGARAPLDEKIKNVIKKINKLRSTEKVIVISCDVPSGLDADTGTPIDEVAIKADYTITMAVNKIGFKNSNYTGIVKVVDIGYPFVK
ncbi:MAG: NAD(P)H-hydrate epimerase [bacterium]|nr:NAD(P)H-hydrate epimerase [bacterium]